MAGRIPEFDSQQADRGLQVNEQGTEAWAHAGRTINALYREGGDALGHSIKEVGGQVGQYLDNQNTQNEIIDNAPKVMKGAMAAQQQTQQMMNDPSYDPNNPDHVAKVQKVLDDWRQSSIDMYHDDKAKMHGVSQIDSIYDHMFKSTTADNATIAGHRAHQSAEDMINAAGQMATEDSTTQGLRLSEKLVTDHASAVFSNPNIDQKAAAMGKDAYVRQGLAQVDEAHLMSRMQKNPDDAQKAIEAGDYNNVPPVRLQELRQHIDVIRNQHDVKDRQAKIDGEKQENGQVADVLHQVYMSGIKPDTGQFSPDAAWFAKMEKIGNNPQQYPALQRPEAANAFRAQYELGQRVQQEQLGRAEKGVTNSSTYEDFSNRLTLPVGDPNRLTETQIVQARAKGQLDDHSLNFFQGSLDRLSKDRGAVAEQKAVNQIMGQFKTTITKSSPMSGSDPQGDQRWGQFQQAGRDWAETAKANGATVHDIGDPTSKYYIGNVLRDHPEFIQGGKAATQEMMQNLTKGTSVIDPVIKSGGDNPQRNAGETGAAYIKRLQDMGKL